ncbi:MAG: ABC transporter substrate-binding protein [Bacteroidia bacterium]|nr:ABC transporter substrate-binding protein [Bacteroidia bacterium]
MLKALQQAIMLLSTLCILCFLSCTPKPTAEGEKEVPLVAFIDYVEDATLAEAKQGFFDALRERGFSEDSNTIAVLYRNAQGDQPTLLQAVDYVISQKPALIATNTTLSTINTVQRNRDIPVFMIVAPRPDIAGLTDKAGKHPPNLFGVYETLDYIDTSVTLIRKLFPHAKKAGTIYSQSESQSVDALRRLKAGCKALRIELEALPVSNSSETQLVTQSLLAKNIDVFFALPDNVIFSSFETVVKSCDEKNIPVLTSEAGLVKRGALASFGADMYQWGYQSGKQAAEFLKQGNSQGLSAEIVQVRKRVMKKSAAEKYGWPADSSFSMVP